jgi:hypothetical protein
VSEQATQPQDRHCHSSTHSPPISRHPGHPRRSGRLALGIIVLIVAIHVAVCSLVQINSDRAAREMAKMRSGHHR